MGRRVAQGLFSSFLLLCVDGELVCAEGYTQVTGVMAMMMAGRVLLVCVLCVLWCGAGGGYAWNLDANIRNHYYGPNGVFCKSFPNTSFCDETTVDKPPTPAAESSVAVGKAEPGGKGSGQASAGDSAGEQDQSPLENGSVKSEEEEGTHEPQPPEGNETGTPELNTTREGETEALPPPQPPSSSLSAPPVSSGSSALPKPAAEGDSESSDTTTEPQAADNSQLQTQLTTHGNETETEAPTPTEVPPAGGPENSTEKTDSDRPEEESEGTQESQLPHGNETETPTTATVTADQTNATMM
ncbi:mucin-associated surface protein (MASP), putative, partial [Trypanosoma cruzi marinkellei]